MDPATDPATDSSGNTYLKVQEDHLINEKYIKWLRKYDECVFVCNKPDGCMWSDTYKVCKGSNPTTYDKLNRLFG